MAHRNFSVRETKPLGSVPQGNHFQFSIARSRTGDFCTVILLTAQAAAAARDTKSESDRPAKMKTPTRCRSVGQLESCYFDAPMAITTLKIGHCWSFFVLFVVVGCFRSPGRHTRQQVTSDSVRVRERPIGPLAKPTPSSIMHPMFPVPMREKTCRLAPLSFGFEGRCLLCMMASILALECMIRRGTCPTAGRLAAGQCGCIYLRATRH